MNSIIFDMDGVLFDTERLCRDSWVLVAEKYGIGDMEQTFPLCIGRNSTDVEGIIRGRYGQDFPYETFRKDASDLFWEAVERDGRPWKKGVKEVLEFLRENDWRIGLASSTKRESVVKHLEQAGILDYFSAIVGGDEIVHSKPEPDIYLLACEKLNVDPKQTYAVEDSYYGILSAYRAGMKPIMVPDLLPPTEEMRQCSKVILEDLLQVRDYLRTKSCSCNREG